jgi:flagellar basal body-associated protein FliL
MTVETATQRSKRASTWLAITVAVVVLVLAAAMTPLTLLAHWEKGWWSADPAAVRSDLIGTVHHALEPVHISVWLPGGMP